MDEIYCRNCGEDDPKNLKYAAHYADEIHYRCKTCGEYVVVSDNKVYTTAEPTPDFSGHKDIEFIGICTGDGECFCWEVDKATYIKIKGWDKEKAIFNCVDVNFQLDYEDMKESNRFRIYPDDIFGFSSKNKKKISIKWEDVVE
jgi:hypothetical protein